MGLAWLSLLDVDLGLPVPVRISAVGKFFIAGQKIDSESRKSLSKFVLGLFCDFSKHFQEKVSLFLSCWIRHTSGLRSFCLFSRSCSTLFQAVLILKTDFSSQKSNRFSNKTWNNKFSSFAYKLHYTKRVFFQSSLISSKPAIFHSYYSSTMNKLCDS